jgi:hypothetical protein
MPGMHGFDTVPPPQKYMTLAEIGEAYGAKAVVAYNCKVDGEEPLGGYVIAAQSEPGAEHKLKEFMRQLKSRYPVKQPVFYLRRAGDASGKTYIYDSGGGEVRFALKPEFTKSPLQEAIEQIPIEVLALALSTSLKSDAE